MFRGQALQCRDIDTVCVWRATFFVALLLANASPGSALASNPSVPTTVDRILDESGQARAEGNLGLAYALLHDAVRIAPNHAQARWQLGQVKIGDEWLSIEESQRRAAADPRQAKYQDRKSASIDSPEQQLALARWCRQNDLEDEARLHWAAVLSVDPNNKEALRAVQMRWRDGQLMSAADFKEARQQSGKSQEALRHWKAEVAAWMRELSDKNRAPRSEVVDAIRAIDDVSAIPAFESLTLREDLPAPDKNIARQRLSLAFLGALRDMPDVEATNSLVRYAVRSPYGDVRGSAISELRYRPLTDFVPTLLDELVAPIQSEYRVQTEPDGSVHYLHNIYREGPFADQSFRRTRSIYRPDSPLGVLANFTPAAGRSLIMPGVANATTRAVTPAGAQRSASRYEQEIMAGEQQVQSFNQQTAAVNERIATVLNGVSDQSLGSEPREWWNWWQDYTDYYRTDDRPVYETREDSSDYIVRPVEPTGCECFVRGTPVWTKTGAKPIESLSIGDLVLAQNVNSGEIAYKPVLLRTLRPAGPTLQIETCAEKILSTRGHPYWIDGTGWRMAKELEKDAMLHSVTGATPVESVTPAPDAETYNLVVADFNTYFVGESGLLVHDNTPRRPTRTFVPGLIAK
jgi:hypothetical protein